MRPAKQKSVLVTVALWAAYLAVMALICIPAAVVWRGFDQVRQTADAEFRFELAIVESLRLNERARIAAQMATESGEQSWRDQFAQNTIRLKATLRSTRELLPPADRASFDPAEAAHAALLDLEEKALGLAAAGRRDEGEAILNSADALHWQAAFGSSIESAARRGLESHEATRADARERLGIFVAVITAAVALVFTLLAFNFNAARRQAAALALAKSRLTEVNAHLENRIQARTADLEMQRQKFRDFAEMTSDWFWETNDRIEIESVSDNFAAVTGIAKENFVGLSLLQLEPSDQHAQVTQEWRSLLARRRDVGSMYVMIHSPTRGRVYFRFSARAVRDDGGEFVCYRGTSADITQALERARATQQGQKLQALGTMAAGLAHEFNNILSIVMGYAESLRAAMNGNEEAVAELDQITQAGRRGASLAKSLLAFGRSSKSQTSEIFNSLTWAVELPQLIKPLLGPDYSLVIEAPRLPLWVNGDRDLLLQCIINLVVNARDAMPKGGSIAMALSLEPAGSARLVRAALPAGRDFVAIEVSDTGIGMNEETMRRIFDPFFTTKKVGKGTGLGLSLLFSTVKDHQGHVEVESKPNKGTTFVILLPLSAPPVLRAVSNRDGAASDLAGLRVLLLDDEPPLLAIYEKMLRSLGFDVVAFTDANKALEMVDDERQQIDLIVSDVLMPQMSGFKFAELARSLRQVEILFVTGQPERGPDDDPVPEAAKILRKPFDRNQLSQAIGELLGAKAAA